MRRNVIWGMSTLSVLVLLASYHTSLAGPDATATADVTGASPAPGSTGATTTPGSAGGTVTGDAASTRYGPVQVQITLADGKITAAKAIQYPHTDRHDVQINGHAIPILNHAAVQAQSADLDSVSGATMTSVAYRKSLQSAIDKANL